MKNQNQFIVGLFAMALICFSFVSINAQSTFGVKGGYLLPNVKVDGFGTLAPEANNISSFSYGLFSETAIDEHFYFQAELLHTRNGFSLEEEREFEVFEIDVPVGAKVITKADYVQVPLLMKYKFGNEGGVRAYLMGGPSFAYAAHATSQLKASLILEFNLGKRDLDLSKDIYNRFEVGGLFGAGVEVPFHKSKLHFEARYHQGYTDLLDDPIIDIKLKNYSFGFMAGATLNI